MMYSLERLISRFKERKKTRVSAATEREDTFEIVDINDRVRNCGGCGVDVSGLLQHRVYGPRPVKRQHKSIKYLRRAFPLLKLKFSSLNPSC